MRSKYWSMGSSYGKGYWEYWQGNLPFQPGWIKQNIARPNGILDRASTSLVSGWEMAAFQCLE